MTSETRQESRSDLAHRMFRNGWDSMKRCGLLYSCRTDEAQQLARETESKLRDLGVSTWCASAGDESHVLRCAPDSDMLITFGGDGTIVRAARLSAGFAVPILGINFGRLGFLAELQPEQLSGELQGLVSGQYRLEERMMLHADLIRDGKPLRSFEALNDVVVSRGSIARVVRVDVHVDGQYLANYVADGIVVSTATGSTAYSLAAGGPVLDPSLRDILLTPIAPHLSIDRTLVLPDTAAVRLAVSAGYEAMCTVDGQAVEALGDGDVVAVAASRHVCRFVRLGEDKAPYRSLLEKLR